MTSYPPAHKMRSHGRSSSGLPAQPQALNSQG
ncbi:hypothetical protein LUZ100_gp02 [Pseudomonas phage LUZ100]|nr:hypothetical protein LUZ100_gp02 [Pseudomonas phage LUZ100]